MADQDDNETHGYGQLSSDPKERKDWVGRVMSLSLACKVNADKFQLGKKIENAEKYYRMEFTQTGPIYSDYRYSKTMEVVETFLPLLAGNRPRYAFTPVGSEDTAMVSDVTKVNDYIRNKSMYNRAKNYAVKNMLADGTAYIVTSPMENGMRDYQTVRLGGILLGDWTEKDMGLQPYWFRPYYMDTWSVKDRWPHAFDDIVKHSGSKDALAFLDKIWNSYREQKNANWANIQTSDEIIKEWNEDHGRCLVMDYWHWKGDKIFLGHIVNGVGVDYDESVWPVQNGKALYPIAKYALYPQDGHALGIGLTEILKPYSDLRTNQMQLASFFASLAICAVPESVQKTDAELKDAFKEGLEIMRIPDASYAQLVDALKFITPNAGMDQRIRLLDYLTQLENTQIRNANYVSGIGIPEGDSGVKVGLGQEAGSAWFKMQQNFMADDGDFRQGEIDLWHVKNMLPDSFRARVNDDGTTKFMRPMNIPITKQQIVEMTVKAASEQPFTIDGVEISPDEAQAQLQIMARSEDLAKKEEKQYEPRLFDTSIIDLDIEIVPQDVSMLAEIQRRNAAMPLYEAGVIDEKAVLGAFGYPNGLKDLEDMPVAKQLKQAIEMLKQLQGQASAPSGGGGGSRSPEPVPAPASRGPMPGMVGQ